MSNVFKRIIHYIKRPRCPNDYRCFECEHMGYLKARQNDKIPLIMICKIDAR